MTNDIRTLLTQNYEERLKQVHLEQKKVQEDWLNQIRLEQKKAYEDRVSLLRQPLPRTVYSRHDSGRQALDSTLGVPSFENQALRELTSRHNAEIEELRKKLAETQAREKQSETERAKLQELHEKLTLKQSLSHMLTRVEPRAQQEILTSEEFRSQLGSDIPCEAFVIAIDVRRSTELMLKSREPRRYAEFLNLLVKGLQEIILRNHGIFDKFTGDGVLAYFPQWYSGVDAGFLALRAASECHDFFRAHYDQRRADFIALLTGVGLGIGLDFGIVHTVRLQSEFSIVGVPVVYACRMANAPAGQTFLNQPAFEKLFDPYSAYCKFGSFEIEIKHDGGILAYQAELCGKLYQPTLPDWLKPLSVPPETSVA